MSIATRSEGEAGSTVVELLIAATLTVVAVSVLAGDALPALRVMTEVAGPQARRVELEAAGDVVARVVRAARPDVTRPVIDGDTHRLSVALGRHRTATVELDAGALRIAVEDPDAATFPSGVVLEGLDMERSGFTLLGPEAAPADRPGAGGAIVIVLADEDVEIVRIVAPRLGTHLDGAAPW